MNIPASRSGLPALTRRFARALLPTDATGLVGTLMLLAGLISCSAAERMDTAPITDPRTPPLPATEEAGWDFAASVSLYDIPDSDDYLQPSFTADRQGLHLEARYNYEAPETASLWVGHNWDGGSQVTWELTAMLGGVVGETFGVAPGARGTLTWWKLELSSEAEIVFDVGEATDSFFYSWSELSIVVLDLIRLGGAMQRTRLYESDREVQVGLLAGLATPTFFLTMYLFNLDDERPTLVLTAGYEF